MSALFNMYPISKDEMHNIKKMIIDSRLPVSGYPLYYCEETGEMYPYPTNCELFFRKREVTE